MKNIIEEGCKDVKHVIHAACFSFDGLVTCFRRERAFRLECLLGFVHVPAAVIVPDASLETVVLVLVWLFLLAGELVNSAIEEVVDAVSPQWSPWAKRAKDYGSAVVLTALVALGVCWCYVLARRWA